MPIFSKKSLDRLATCHIDLQNLFLTVVKYWDCTILEGARGEADQNAAFDRGASKLRYPMGRHNKTPSMAVDVAPWRMPEWNKNADFYYFGGFVMGVAAMLRERRIISHDIIYGADWNCNQRISDEKFIDAVHFEIKE